MKIRIWSRIVIVTLGLSGVAPVDTKAFAEERQVRMSDGSLLTLTAVFYVKKRERWRRQPGSRADAVDTLTIWTHRTGIPARGEVFTEVGLLNKAGHEYRPRYTGGFYQGPTPSEWSDQWELAPPPPLGEPLVLRISPRGQHPGPSTVEFTLPYTQEWKSQQFASRTPDQWMAEAVSRSDTEMIWVLLEWGAHVHVRGENGFTPLMVTAYIGDLALARTLLNSGAALDTRNGSGATAMFYAIIMGGPKRSEMVELLLSRGADPNLGARYLSYPIVWAAQRGDVRATAALLARGARPSAAALQAAKEGQHWQIVRLLKKAMASRRSVRSRP